MGIEHIVMATGCAMLLTTSAVDRRRGVGAGFAWAGVGLTTTIVGIVAVLAS